MPSITDTSTISNAREMEIAKLRRCIADGPAKGKRGVHEIALPDELYRVLRSIVEDLADGKAVSVTSAAQEMTTQHAANFLGVSRQFLVRLLDEGKIPFHRTGTHRRVYLQDLISFRKERDLKRHKAIQQIARQAVRDGMYDEF